MMDIETMLKNLNGNNLQQAMQQMGKMLTPEQMQTVKQMLTNNRGQVKETLNRMDTNSFQKELSKNPKLAQQLANNPEIMKKINQLLGN